MADPVIHSARSRACFPCARRRREKKKILSSWPSSYTCLRLHTSLLLLPTSHLFFLSPEPVSHLHEPVSLLLPDGLSPSGMIGNLFSPRSLLGPEGVPFSTDSLRRFPVSTSRQARPSLVRCPMPISCEADTSGNHGFPAILGPAQSPRLGP
jgi:hypothetical protein